MRRLNAFVALFMLVLCMSAHGYEIVEEGPAKASFTEDEWKNIFKAIFWFVLAGVFFIFLGVGIWPTFALIGLTMLVTTMFDIVFNLVWG